MGKPKADVNAQPREVLRLRERLDEWRQSRDRGKAFPEEFWVSAGRLARQHGVDATAYALGLEYNKLKRASGGTTGRGWAQRETGGGEAGEVRRGDGGVGREAERAAAVVVRAGRATTTARCCAR